MMEYRVELDTYSGPLDLLLYLVKRHEVEIVDLPIADITHQFLEFLEVLKQIDLDTIGDFVVLASTLVEIKSHEVLPLPEQPPELVEAVEHAREDLVRQLVEYKRFREAAKLLEEQSAQWQLRYPRLSDDRPRRTLNPAEDLIKEVELWDLVSALSRVLQANTAVSPTSIVYDDTPIAVYIARLQERVLAEHRVSFSSFFDGANNRSKITGIFLAILELLRHYGFRAEQPIAYSEIWILPPLPESQHAPENMDPRLKAVQEGADLLSTESFTSANPDLSSAAALDWGSPELSDPADSTAGIDPEATENDPDLRELGAIEMNLNQLEQDLFSNEGWPQELEHPEGTPAPESHLKLYSETEDQDHRSSD